MMPNRRFDYLFAELAKPFPDEKVLEKKPGKPHYITAKMVMNRLDTVLGPMNWWDEYTTGGEDSILCRLTIRLPDGSTVTKCDAGGFKGMSNDGDDDKSGYSDSFKRAAVKFTIGRYLNNGGVPVLPSKSVDDPGTTGPEQVVERNQVTAPVPVTAPEPVQEATQASQAGTEPESKGLDGQPFKSVRTFWNDILDGVSRTNAGWLEDHPDSEEIVGTNAVVMKLIGICYEAKCQPIPPDAEVGPDGKPMTPSRWAGVLNKVARKSPEMHAWLKSHLDHFLGEMVSYAKKLEARGTRGPR